MFLVVLLSTSSFAVPQGPRTFSSVLVQEVDTDEESKAAFGNSRFGTSILYSSLPDFSIDLSNFEEGDVVGEIVVEVESPDLVLTKATDPEGKLRERAEARRTGPRRPENRRGIVRR